MVLAAGCVLSGSLVLGSTIEGFTEPFRTIELAAAEPGTLATLSVHEGDQVKQNQILATLDSDVLMAMLNAARAAMEAHGKLDSAEAEVALRRTRLEKLETLRSRAHASQEEVERARGDLEIAEANLLAAREQQTISALECKKVEAMLERRVVRSPIDGLVSQVLKDEREFVSPNSPAIFTVVQLNPLRVIFSVPTLQAESLKAGQSVPLVFPETELKAQGRIEYVSPITDAESGTVRVKVLIDNSRGLYRCGVRCALELPDLARPASQVTTLEPGTLVP